MKRKNLQWLLFCMAGLAMIAVVYASQQGSGLGQGLGRGEGQGEGQGQFRRGEGQGQGWHREAGGSGARIAEKMEADSNTKDAKDKDEGEEEDRLRGRDIVRLGKLTELTGTLKPEKGEWFVETEDGAVYEIHLGDHKHRAETGIALEKGKTATVSGFLYQQEGNEIIDIAVCTVKLDGKEYRFREDDGTPLWRGSGGGGRHGQQGNK